MKESLTNYSQYNCEESFAIVFALQLWDVRGKSLSSRMYASSPQDVKLQLNFKVLVTSRCLSQGWRGIPRYEASALIVIFDRSTQPWAPATRNSRISWRINPDCKMWCETSTPLQFAGPARWIPGVRGILGSLINCPLSITPHCSSSSPQDQQPTMLCSSKVEEWKWTALFSLERLL